MKYCPTQLRIDTYFNINSKTMVAHTSFILIMLISQIYNEFREIATDNHNSIERFSIVTAIKFCHHHEILHDFPCERSERTERSDSSLLIRPAGPLLGQTWLCYLASPPAVPPSSPGLRASRRRPPGG